jgi:agmatinase
MGALGGASVICKNRTVTDGKAAKERKRTMAETRKSIIAMLRESRDAIPLDPNDPLRDVRAMYRDDLDDPTRAPGPINIQRLRGGLGYQGIPTFFRAPVALTPEDLRAGGVDVAFIGASIDQTVGQRGTAYGPQAVRTGEVLYPWGSAAEMAHPAVGDVDFGRVLNLVDYGDAAVDMLSPEGSILSVHGLVKEIAEAGAIPMIIGGDHSLMYPDVVAVTDVHGKGEVGVVHFDAHFDAVDSMFGHTITNGTIVRRLIEEGHVKGRNFVQIGLNAQKPCAGEMEWMRQNEIRYHFLTEFEDKGWRGVMADALAEALDGPRKIFVSVDMDVLDPAYAPGVGTPEPGGMTPRELFPMLRALGAQNEIVGAELVEVNPLVDQSYRTSLMAVRILRELLTGIALRRKGITDPFYVDRDWIGHKVPRTR